MIRVIQSLQSVAKNGFLFSFVFLMVGGVHAANDDKGDPPFWDGSLMDRETVLFVQKEGETAAATQLLFTPGKILRVTDVGGKVVFEEGKDYTHSPGSSALTLTADSRIPFKTQAELHPSEGRIKSLDKKGYVLWSEGHFYHDLQVNVTYEHADRWAGAVPESAADKLPATVGKLKAKAPLKLVVFGDSITRGYNSSGFLNVPPEQPPYGGLLQTMLQERYGSQVAFANISQPGARTPWGLTNLSRVIAEKPDLLIIAFGMNRDPSPQAFAVNVRQMIDQVHQPLPATEIILVSCMLPNPEASESGEFLAERDELRKLTGPGVALADVTSMWQELLKHKRFYDLTGNGYNHPNDFGHRVYAQTLRALLQ